MKPSTKMWECQIPNVILEFIQNGDIALHCNVYVPIVYIKNVECIVDLLAAVWMQISKGQRNVNISWNKLLMKYTKKLFSISIISELDSFEGGTDRFATRIILVCVCAKDRRTLDITIRVWIWSWCISLQYGDLIRRRSSVLVVLFFLLGASDLSSDGKKEH